MFDRCVRIGWPEYYRKYVLHLLKLRACFIFA